MERKCNSEKYVLNEIDRTGNSGNEGEKKIDKRKRKTQNNFRRLKLSHLKSNNK